MFRYVIGIDLAKLHDYTAVTVLDTQLLASKSRYAVTAVYRYPIGIEYSRVADHILEQVFSYPYHGDIVLIVDATGLGNPVLEQLRKRIDAVIGLTITGGTRVNVEGSNVRVPKVTLIGTLLSIIENRRLFFAESAQHLDALVQELMAFQGKFSEGGRIQYEGRGAHDDMVMSLSMATWYVTEGLAAKKKPMIYAW